MEKDYYPMASPTTAWLTLNRACNFRCPWCYAEGTGYSKKDNLDIGKAKKIIQYLSELEIDRAVFIGGEPTLYPELFELNDECHSRGMKTSIVTNASSFANDLFWSKYLDCPCDNAGISIKAISKLSAKNLLHMSERQFHTMITGLERGLSIHGSDGVSTVLNNLISVEEVKEMAVQAKRFGAKSFMLSLCNATLDDNHSSGDFMLEKAEVAKASMELAPYLDELYEGNIILELSLPLCYWPEYFIDQLIYKGQLSSLCHMQGRSGVVFSTDGDILPCNSMIGQKIIDWGQYHSVSELINILNSEEISSLYSTLLRYPAECCSNCRKNDFCRGGCVVNWTILSPESCNPFEGR